ncbi:MAG: class I tRNA ligase family protein [Polyangiales bacterium]
MGANAFSHAFPADFITEAVDQTRGWFYSLMAISFPCSLPNAHFRIHSSVFVMGLVTDEKGKKLSKRDKNYTDPEVDARGGSSMRFVGRFTSALLLGKTRAFRIAQQTMRRVNFC